MPPDARALHALAHDPGPVIAVCGASLAPAAASDRTCAGSDFKQINFLVGNWRVSTPDGTVIGHDSFVRALGDCGFDEYWRDVAGNNPHSRNRGAARDRNHRTQLYTTK